MKRGWILFYSVLVEVVILAAICVVLWFVSISAVWKILIALGGLTGMIVLGFCLVYFWWASNNLYFTFVREGTAKIVVRAHRFHKALIRFKGYGFNDEWNVTPVLGDEDNKAPSEIWFKAGDQGNWIKDGERLDVIEVVDIDRGILRVRKKIPILRKRGRIEEIEMKKLVKGVKLYRPVRSRGKEGFFERFFGGLVYYGFWPLDDIFVYEFEWSGMIDSGELEPHPSEWLDYIFVKDDVYGCEVTKAEDKELMPLDIKLTLTVRIINPYKALFVIENWYETMINRVRPYVRDFITTDTYTNFTKNPIRIDIGVWERLEREGILDELVNRYGIDIRKIEVHAIDPEERFREATMRRVLALREKEEIITRARAERERLATVAQGEKKRIDTVYGAVASHGELGEKIRGYEALEKSTGEGAKWVIPVEVTRLFSRVLSGEQSHHRSRRD